MRHSAAADSEGVRVVHLAPLNSIDVPEWHAETLWSTKQLSGRNVELSSVTFGLFLPNGDLVLADAGSSELLMLDSMGAGVRHLGREGEGPGEFEWLGRLIPAGRGGFSAWDGRLGRLSFFDAEGTFVRAQALALFGQPLTVLADGTVLAIRPDDNRFQRRGERRDTAPLVRYGPNRGLDTVGLWPGLEKNIVEGRTGWLMMPVGFGRSVAYASNGSNTVISSTDSLDLTEYSWSLRPVLRLVAPPDARHPGEAEKAAWRTRVLDAASQGSRGDPSLRATFLADYRVALKTDPFRESYPAFDGLAIDAAGRLWIGEYPDPGAPSRRWIILDPDGIPVGQLHLPLRFLPGDDATELLAAGTNRIAILRLDSLGLERVEVRRVGAAP